MCTKCIIPSTLSTIEFLDKKLQEGNDKENKKIKAYVCFDEIGELSSITDKRELEAILQFIAGLHKLKNVQCSYIIHWCKWFRDNAHYFRELPVAVPSLLTLQDMTSLIRRHLEGTVVNLSPDAYQYLYFMSGGRIYDTLQILASLFEGAEGSVFTSTHFQNLLAQDTFLFLFTSPISLVLEFYDAICVGTLLLEREVKVLFSLSSGPKLISAFEKEELSDLVRLGLVKIEGGVCSINGEVLRMYLEKRGKWMCR